MSTSQNSSWIRPTQRDIAKALNLSQSSVAFALDPKYHHKLPSDTIALVQETAKKLHYRPQRLAKIFRKKRSYTIAVVMVSAKHHAPQERVKMLTHHAMKLGYQLVAVDLDWFNRDEAAARDYLLDTTAEGVIFCNVTSQDRSGWLRFFHECQLPFVTLSGALTNHANAAKADIQSAYREMTLHHLRTGAQRPALLFSHRDADYRGPFSPSILDRVNGFVEAMQSVGGSVTSSDGSLKDYLDQLAQKNTPAMHHPFTRQGTCVQGTVIYPIRLDTIHDPFELGYYQIEQLLKQGQLPDSLICSNDEIAMGALAACAKYQIAVPNTLRISGADNALYSRFGAVPLTTIQQPSDMMAKWCVQRITDLIEHPEQRKAVVQKTFPCQIVARQSTKGVDPLETVGSPFFNHEKY